jgi:hypothetical protein
MTYELSWYIPDRVLSLGISGKYTLEDARQVNLLILQELDRISKPLILFIDAMGMQRPDNFQGIRSTQTYMNHQKLKRIVVAANDRVVKLAMMVIFNISRADLTLFDSIEQANTQIQKQVTNFK